MSRLILKVKMPDRRKGVRLLTGGSIDSKYWQTGYPSMANRRVFSIGVYLAVSLADARQRRDEGQRLLAPGD